MRVGLDGRALESPAAGVRRYTRELLAGIKGLGPGIEVVVFSTSTRRGSRSPTPGNGEPGRWRRGSNLVWCLAALPLAVRRAPVDVFHAPAYTAPLWGVHPLVLTIHDVSYARHPEWYPYRRDAWRRAFYRACARAADLVVTDSEFSRAEIAAAYDIDPARIAVIPLGVGPPFVPGEVDGRALPRGVRGPYVLHVGDLHARRNLVTALRAVVSLRQRVASLRSLQLVLVGVDRGEGGRLDELARRLGHPEALRFAGVPGDETLVDLYRRAAALVYPSRYEGFGLPVLEAMACGTPVVAARAGALPEVVGPAAPLVDPDDVEGFARALEPVLIDPEARREAQRRGLERAAQFSWRRTAELTVAAYRRCADEASARTTRARGPVC